SDSIVTSTVILPFLPCAIAVYLPSASEELSFPSAGFSVSARGSVLESGDDWQPETNINTNTIKIANTLFFITISLFVNFGRVVCQIPNNPNDNNFICFTL